MTDKNTGEKMWKDLRHIRVRNLTRVSGCNYEFNLR